MTVATADIMAGLFTHLNGASTFKTAMAGGVWQTRAEAGATLPYAVCEIIDGLIDDTFDKDGIEYRVQVSIWEAERLGPTVIMGHMDKLHARIHGTKFTATGHQIVTPRIEITRGPFADTESLRMDADIIIEAFVS